MQDSLILPKSWNLVSLGQLLKKSKESVEPDLAENYQQITIKMWGQGVVLRQEVLGSEIKAKRQLVARSGQFILSRIDARHGAFGLVPDSLDGALVSNDFPCFELEPTSILPDFLNWMSKTASFVEICKAASEGTTNRVRLKEDIFLDTKIPLPPLQEQRRIVGRIEALVEKVEEARGVRAIAVQEAENTCRAIIFSEQCSKRMIPMSQLLTLRSPDVVVSPTENYSFAGVYSFGRGVFQQHTISGMDFSYKKLTTLNEGNFVYPKLMAWEGALGTVPAACDGLVVSTEFPVFEVNEKLVLSETLDTYFRTPLVWEILAGISSGTNMRRRRLNPKDFLKFEMPVPDMNTQKLLRSVRAKTNDLKKLQAQTEAELNALIPAILDKAFKGEL